ncbi:MAG: FtsH protease activity modulator HflK [Spirochaetales bacterium]|nr:FtsH protease activity modulator HflK [Spirochaetales bacterium]
MSKNIFTNLNYIISDLKKIARYVVLLLIILYLCSGFYSISQSELGILQRFGRIIDKNVKPGIHYALPWPIDKVDKVPVKIVKRIFIDDFIRVEDKKSTSNEFYRLSGLSSYCITGDNNIIEISCSLHYTISDPVKYLFTVKDSEQLLHEITCNTIVHCIAQFEVNEILKRKIISYIKNKLEQTLDLYNTGLVIAFIELKEVRPPKEVQKYFDDVINAQIDKIKMMNDAESYKNEKIPEAKGKVSRKMEDAKAYKKKIILEAEGETEKFLNKLNVYVKSKKITKKQLYYEFVKKIFPQITKKYIISGKDNKNPALLKIFLSNEEN